MADENIDLPLPNPDGGNKGNPLVPILILALVMPILVGAIAYFVIVPKINNAQADHAGHGPGAKAEALAKLDNMQVYEVKDIMTNIGGMSQARFVKASFSIEGSNPEFTAIVEKHKDRVRDSALTILSTLTVQDMERAGLKNIVKSNLINAINRSMEPSPPLVENLYFSEFVIQ